MKKIVAILLLTAIAFPAAAVPQRAVSKASPKKKAKAVATTTATDPFFMLATKKSLLDSELSYTNNYWGGDGFKAWMLDETFRYGLSDRWNAFVSLGFANGKWFGESNTGLKDPDFGVRYRAKENISAYNMTLDLEAHFSPSVFDSPLNTKSNGRPEDGVAKGSTDFGVKAILGHQAARGEQWSWGGLVNIEFVGKTDINKSATDFYLGGFGKYYIDTINSVDGLVSLGMLGKRNNGWKSETSLRLAAGYSRVLTEELDLFSHLGFATHSADGLKTETFLSVGLRWLF